MPIDPLQGKTWAMGSITQGQLDAISVIERACSVLSLLGCLFIIATFCSSASFHKPINRLVFYASFGNVFAVVGTLMSRSYMNDLDSFGCQFQGGLIQLFMPADAFWTLAMAINVYLTFYYKFDAARLRRMEIPYLIGCYGVPAIPAFAFLFIRNGDGVRVYGNATLWCWISQDWDILRIAVFYGPVWVVIFVTFFIYLRAGRTIYEKRKQLHEFHSSDHDPLSVNGEAVTTIRTTEVTVTTEVAGDNDIPLGQMNPRESISGAGPSSRGPNGVYSVHISADAFAYKHDKDEPVQQKRGSTIQQTASTRIASRRPANIARRRNHELNNAAWSYTKCSILFFTAIIITWIPSSANRVYSLVHDKDTSIPLEFMSAFVLPLQGFWNAVIYTTTSWSACKDLWNSLRTDKRPATSEVAVNRRDKSSRMDHRSRRRCQFGSPAGSSQTVVSESTTELAKDKTHSPDGGYHC